MDGAPFRVVAAIEVVVGLVAVVAEGAEETK